MKERIFVTGGTGFIGKRLILTLSSFGAEIFVLARSEKKAREIKSQYPKIKIIMGDLQSPNKFEQQLSSIETVYHLGAKTGVWGGKKEFEEINYYGTKNLLDAAEKHGVKKFVYYSTQNVTYKYGFLTPQKIQNQDSPYLKESEYRDYYSLSKAKAEKYVLAKNRKGFHAAAIRPGWAWGPGDVNLFSDIVTMTQKKLVIMPGGGKNQAAISYVDNINHAAILAAQNPEAAGQAFYVTDDHPITTGEFIHDLLEAAGLPYPNFFIPYFLAYPLAGSMEVAYRIFKIPGRPPLTRFDVTGLAKNMLLDINSTKIILGYKPPVPYLEGMKQFKKWWWNEGLRFFEQKNKRRLKLRKEV